MALTSISTSTVSAPQPDKSINLVHYNATNAQNTVYYTVPAGRKFKGLIWTNDVSYKLGKFPGHTGSEQFMSPFLSNTQNSYIPVEAVAGDFVSGLSNYAYHHITGIESDA
jgi:hypothetical protein